jgi:hypothetical protein
MLIVYLTNVHTAGAVPLEMKHANRGERNRIQFEGELRNLPLHL